MSHFNKNPPVTGVRASKIPALDDTTEAQMLHFPSHLLRDLERHAKRIGKSVDWCLDEAWRIAEQSARLEAVKNARLLGGRATRQRVELPIRVWRHVTAEAEHLDRSKSWLMQRAWLIARKKVA